MATQIVIANDSYIKVDDTFHIEWADKGNAWQAGWVPNTIHAVIWNALSGQNEIQSKDPATGNMTGNTDLNATSDAVGSTTIAALLTWSETRKGQIEAAITAYNNAYRAAFDSWIAAGKTPGTFREDNSETNSYWDWSKTWKDYDSNYS
mgnify:FL=1|jgi:hypothetical protein